MAVYVMHGVFEGNCSFQQGLEKTAKSNYAGGDTSWEEEKLGSYADR